ncbi:uncharacterized protein LOC133786039 [Humulus lupulus]|uniref:uncharacterized protein LOC133786039 n=1 Tax=Humulus lupulus TaxID=3486 RepID=UPI002B408EC6|nr:uncharacterized protein LOC133786039 [Humulus lupulus]
MKASLSGLGKFPFVVMANKRDECDLHKVCEIKALKKSGVEKAWKILENVAKQIQPIMCNHKWRVKLLFEVWFNGALSLDLSNDHPNMRIIHRIVAIILGQWVSEFWFFSSVYLDLWLDRDDTKLLWRGAECWNGCLKLLGIAEATEASMDSDQLSSGISDFDTHFQGLIVQKSQLSNVKSVERSSRPFVMRVLDDEVDDIDNAYEEAQDRSSLSANRFNFNDLYVSDDDDSENESALESDLDFLFSNFWVIICSAEALDNHLTAIQRDHELRSQIEERKIRSDAAYEGAKRKEKALLEEKLRQEKAKAEAEAKLRAEEANRAAMEAQRREAKEAAEREANEASSQAVVQKEALGLQTKAKTKESEFEKPINSASAGDITKAAEVALKLERERLKKLEDLDEGNKALGLNVNKEVSTGVKKLLRESSGQYSDFSILSSLNS